MDLDEELVLTRAEEDLIEIVRAAGVALAALERARNDHRDAVIYAGLFDKSPHSYSARMANEAVDKADLEVVGSYAAYKEAERAAIVAVKAAIK